MSVWIIEQITEYIFKAPCRTEAQMEVMCCEPVGELACCERVDGEWHGFTDEELNDRLAAAGIGIDAQHRDSQGRYVEVVKVARPIACGEQRTEYTLHQRRCCDDWDQIVIDTSKTPDVLPAGGDIGVYWTDGIPPFTIRTSSAGTWLPGGFREVVTDGRWCPVYAGPTFCGVTVITIRDACGSATWVLRSNLGKWQQFYPASYYCLTGGTVDDSGFPKVRISGQYRQDQWDFQENFNVLSEPATTPRDDGCIAMESSACAWYGPAHNPGGSGALTAGYSCFIMPNCKFAYAQATIVDTITRCFYTATGVQKENYYKWVC